jgi:hypothetical protein
VCVCGTGIIVGRAGIIRQIYNDFVAVQIQCEVEKRVQFEISVKQICNKHK